MEHSSSSSLASTYIFTVLPYNNTVRVCLWSLNDALAPGKKVGLRRTELAAKGLGSLDSQGTAFCHVVWGVPFAPDISACTPLDRHICSRGTPQPVNHAKWKSEIFLSRV